MKIGKEKKKQIKWREISKFGRGKNQKAGNFCKKSKAETVLLPKSGKFFDGSLERILGQQKMIWRAKIEIYPSARLFTTTHDAPDVKWINFDFVN